MSGLQDRVAIITGGAGGIGRATARRLSADGALVCVADLDQSRAQTVADELDGPALALGIDVGSEADVITMIEDTTRHFGRVDILYNNAAVLSPDHLPRDGDIAAMDADVWDLSFRVNLRGAMLGCKHVIPRMLQNGGGTIINAASVNGVAAAAMRPAYGASKAGIVYLTKSVAAQYGGRGIRCNAVAPGPIQTPATAFFSSEEIARLKSYTLTGDLGEPEDIAAAVAFLADATQSRFVCGHVLVVDGGRTVPYLGGLDL